MDNKDQIIDLYEKLTTDLLAEITVQEASRTRINDIVKQFNEKRFEVLNVDVELPKEIPLPVEDNLPPTVPVTLEEIAQINIDYPRVRITEVDSEYYLFTDTKRGNKTQLSRTESKENILRMINNL